MIRLSCQEQLIPGGDLAEKWEFIVDAGFSAIELQGPGDFRFRERLPELHAARAAGVVLPSVCVQMDHFIGDFDADRRRDAIDNMKSLLSVMAEIGGRGAITPAAYGLWSNRLPPHIPPPRGPHDDRKVLIESLSELGEHAVANGVTLWLEPLNRYEDHMVNTLATAVGLVQAVGSDGVRVMGDFFHMDIEEAHLAASIRDAGPYLTHMQLGDSNRLEPGAGHLDWAPALAALDEIGYDGYLAMECRLSGDAHTVLPQVAQFLKARMPA